MFCDGEAETGARHRTAAIDTIKTIEDPFDVVGRNAFSLIGNTQHRFVTFGQNFYQHVSAATVFLRVVEKVRQDLLHAR